MAFLRKRWLAITLTCVLLMSSILIWASASGTQSDPLVSKSYIDEVFTPQVLAIVDDAIKQLETGYPVDVQALIDTYTKQIDAKIAEFNSSMGSIMVNTEFVQMLNEAIAEKLEGIVVEPSTVNEVFQYITLKRGDYVLCETGTEVLLRSGSAKAFGESSPVLIDLTSNEQLDIGGNLRYNHMYVTFGLNEGLIAVSDDVSILIRGKYTIG